MPKLHGKGKEAMKKTFGLNHFAAGMALAVVLLLVLTAYPMAAQDDGPGCSLATLTGSYVFDASGWINLGGAWAPKAVVEMLDIKGDGTLTSIATTNIGGNVLGHDIHGSGSYTINADCTGTLAFNPAGPHFDIFVAPNGKEFHMIQTDPGNVLAGAVKRVQGGN